MKAILKNTVVRCRLTASCVALTALIGACANTPPAGSRNVTIQRTTYGIAHITAPDWEGIAYGTAYAHAQDNVCQTAEHLLTLRGERSQFLGAQALGELGLGKAPNAQIDLFIRFHMDDEALARAAATTEPGSAVGLARVRRGLQPVPGRRRSGRTAGEHAAASRGCVR